VQQQFPIKELRTHASAMNHVPVMTSCDHQKKKQILSKHEKHCHEDRATITNYADRVSMTVP
jgi:hypothetical protein